MTNLNHLSCEYNHDPLTEQQLNKDPIQQFQNWFQQAVNNQELEPNAMSLATVNKNYDVSTRMMLLKYFDNNGFVFFSNYNSRKAKAMDETSKAAILFWWPKSQRQVRICGTISKIDPKHSDDYFDKRSELSRFAAISSKQSEPLSSRQQLIDKFEKIKNSHDKSQVIPRPKHWGGYNLTPLEFEFWQGQPHRLHDRFQYKLISGKWFITRLNP